MKAIIICSVHALCNFSDLEREACNRACELHNLPATLTRQDHARLLANTTMLDFLNHLPGSKRKRECLIASYLEILNEEIWSTPLEPYKTIASTCLGLENVSRPKGFVSDYPLLTTNLVRSTTLLTKASRLGHLIAAPNPLHIQTSAAGLAACAASMEIEHDQTEVLVAHRRDFVAARAIGMTPRFIEGLRQHANIRTEQSEHETPTPLGAMIPNLPYPQAATIPA